MYLPGLAELYEPGGNVARHDDQRVLQLSVGLGRQLAVDELAGGDDLLAHSILLTQTTCSAMCFNNFLRPTHLVFDSMHTIYFLFQLANWM